MNKSISLMPHTIVLLAGPSNCGKTYFAENHLIPALSEYNVHHLSSDHIRQELLGKDHHKYDKEMLHISKQAFDVLLNRIKNLSSHPLNAEFIIVDTKGLYKEFRDEILAIAKTNHYQVATIAFSYKNREDFFQYVPEDVEPWINKMINRDIKKLMRETMRELNLREYHQVYRLKDNAFKKLQITIEKEDFYQKTQLKTNQKYRLVGDVHGCFKALKNTYEEAKKNDEQLILVGDFIDKGPDTKKVVEFIHKHLDEFILVKGNHENFVYKWLEGQIEKEKISAEVLKYFDSIELFEKNKILKNKFYKIFEHCTEFVKHRDFIATHAPCRNKFLGKVDKYSLKAQRNFIFPRRKEYDSDDAYQKALQDSFNFLREEAEFNQPYHVFGHMALQNRHVAENKICIDNGCVHGKGLTSVIFDPQLPKPRFHSSPSELKESEVMEGNVPLLFEHKKEEEKMESLNLEPKDHRRIEHLANQKVNFISGTMCPADKQEGELESLEQALDYYRERRVEKVILQPKYMGSRCNIYLFKRVEDCYATSRNGFTIRPDRLDLTPIYKKLIKQFTAYFKERKLKMLLIDGELLPWSALGKELIQDQFKTIATALELETAFLKEEGFEEALKELKGKYEDVNYVHAMKELGKKDFIEKYDHSFYRTLENYGQFSRSSWKSVQSEKEKIGRYKQQLKQYGHDDEEITFKPFMLLKSVDQKGNEECFLSEKHKNTEIYPQISNDPCLILSLKDKKALKNAQKFYEALTIDEGMEGVVIKPEIVFQGGVAPCLKVRNKDYLTIIYGYDYLSEKKYGKLLKKKSICRKLRTSMKEFEIGKKLLEVPYSKINEQNKTYFSLCAQMIVEEKVEKELDPRL